MNPWGQVFAVLAFSRYNEQISLRCPMSLTYVALFTSCNHFSSSILVFLVFLIRKVDMKCTRFLKESKVNLNILSLFHINCFLKAVFPKYTD